MHPFHHPQTHLTHPHPRPQIPLNCSWLHDVLALFQRFPDMGAMGHNGYCFYLDKACTGGITAFELPDTGVHFQFVELADYAPMTFRRWGRGW
jgi:hypothetical protein